MKGLSPSICPSIDLYMYLEMGNGGRREYGGQVSHEMKDGRSSHVEQDNCLNRTVYVSNHAFFMELEN